MRVELDFVAVGGAAGDTVDAAEEPAVSLRIEVDEGEDEFAGEDVSVAAVAVPAVPVFAVADEDVEGLDVAVVAGEVEFVVGGVLEGEDLGEGNGGHEGSLAAPGHEYIPGLQREGFGGAVG